ncbi:MAG TPA: PD-(D/E)XK nuclease-like domain-containing protein [Micromonosporaceae bacterium]|nr:PD-(D/E)XK nuclease-like domain-containing protein [Micromonosporaceae bacterium]
MITIPTAPITSPGVYDIPAETYHADPVPGGSLSASGARRLLPPSCPARYRWWADHHEPPRREYDLGHAAHTLILGAGPQLVVVDAGDWRTKAARQARDDAHAAGHVPLLTADHDTVQAMATALRGHPVAAALLDPARMWPEQTLIWRDHPTGVWRRARLDTLPRPDTSMGSRMILADYKTTGKSADPDSIERAVHDHGYHIQAAWYLAGVEALGLADTAAYLLIVQERDPPYLVTVAEIATGALRIGRQLARRAINTYARCVAAGRWPGYCDDVAYVSLPAWALRQHAEETTP